MGGRTFARVGTTPARFEINGEDGVWYWQEKLTDWQLLSLDEKDQLLQNLVIAGISQGEANAIGADVVKSREFLNDFFDEILYGDEIKKNETEKEQKDETDPDEFEDKAEKMDRYDDINVDLHEVSTDEKEFRKWKGLEEDWQEFNKQDDEDVEGEA